MSTSPSFEAGACEGSPWNDHLRSTHRIPCIRRRRSGGNGNCMGTGKGTIAGLSEMGLELSASSKSRGPTLGYLAAKVKM
mmetsp:Transcript_58636/g.92695  ORF Transcript_58636/g.92695 Transcript_58636/m.92695 type:complete len:80 (+) Transcript_58636:1338-1577(+)